MGMYKTYQNKHTKGTIISFIILLIAITYIFSACNTGDQKEAVKEDELERQVDVKDYSEQTNHINKDYPASLMIKGIDGEEGVVIDDSVKADEINIPTIYGYVKRLFQVLGKGNSLEAESDDVIEKAVKDNWLPMDYTDAMWANPISRGEAMYILLKALGANDIDPWNFEYKDVVGTKYEKEVMYAIEQGYIEGYSTGSFKPDNPLSEKEFEKLIANIGKSYEERTAHWERTAEGRKVRKTNLPENAVDLEYVLADVSNEYYEGCGIITKETGAYWDLFPTRSEAIKPKDLAKEYCDIPGVMNSKDDPNYEQVVRDWHPYQKTIYSNPENFDIVINRYKKYFELCTNVDYRTINDDFALELYLTLYPHLNEELYHKNQPKNGARNIFEAYVDYVKEHKIILKSNRVQVEKSAVYHNIDYMIVRAYVDFDVVNFENIEDSNYYLVTFGNIMGDVPLDKILKGSYKGYVNNVLRPSSHAMRETDFIFAPTDESGVGIPVMLSSYKIVELDGV